MHDNSDPVVDHTEEAHENSLTWMRLKCRNLLIKMQGWISVRDKITKRVLHLSKEDRDSLWIIHELQELAIDSKEVLDVLSFE